MTNDFSAPKPTGTTLTEDEIRSSFELECIFVRDKREQLVQLAKLHNFKDTKELTDWSTEHVVRFPKLRATVDDLTIKTVADLKKLSAEERMKLSPRERLNLANGGKAAQPTKALPDKYKGLSAREKLALINEELEKKRRGNDK